MLPSKFPNLLVNGANGIAVGMATSLPPHNLGEICDALVRVIDEPEVSIDELLEIVPGPDFPTGGVICGRAGIRRGYHTGRGNVVVRARAAIEEHGNRFRIVITEIPFQQARDRIEERIAALANEGKNHGHLGRPQRERPGRAGAAGLRREARRRSGDRAEPALRVLAAARQLSR